MRVTQMDPSSPSKVRAGTPPVFHHVQKPAGFSISSLKKDDWILIGMIVSLLLDGSDDYLLLCALGYLFVMGL